jgi:hypothetical protein
MGSGCGSLQFSTVARLDVLASNLCKDNQKLSSSEIFAFATVTYGGALPSAASTATLSRLEFLNPVLYKIVPRQSSSVRKTSTIGVLNGSHHWFSSKRETLDGWTRLPLVSFRPVALDFDV